MILELLRKLGGKAQIEGIVTLVKTEQFPLDRTHIWDRLISLSRKGIVKNELGFWVIIEKDKENSKNNAKGMNRFVR